MEPDKDLYLPYIQPLLDQNDSKYKLIPASGIIWSNLDTLESQNYLPQQTLFQHGDPRLEKANNTLLFVANLGHNPNKPYMGYPSIAGLMVHQLMTAIRAHSIFQGYGLIRMLVWMGDAEKRKILPRMISHRRKFAIEAELACEKIQEVAGSSVAITPNRREHGLDVEGARNVRNRMIDRQILTPEGRKGELQKIAELDEAKVGGSSTFVDRVFLTELRGLEERWARKEFTAYVDAKGQPLDIEPELNKRHKRGEPKLKVSVEYDRLTDLRYRKKIGERNVDKINSIVLEYEKIVYDLEKADDTAGIEGKSEKDLVMERLEQWRSKLEFVSADNQGIIWQRLDDRRVFHQTPPVLYWDRREFEPLAVKADEFFPVGEMCLLDFHPQSVWPIIRGKNLTNYDFLEFILTGLFITPSQSIITGLKSVAPGADEWIIPRCPALTDTSKGGSVDLESLAVRSLNQEMLEQILAAWMDWPFQPTKAQLMARLGSQAIDNISDDELISLAVSNDS
jgi:transcription factor 1